MRASSRTDSGWTYQELHARAVTTISVNDVQGNGRPPAGSDTLYVIEPSAAVLFHEIFHLVLGNGNGETSPPNYPREVYQVSRMMRIGHEDAVCNPETFTKVATAYDYTRNSNRVDGELIEWFMGFATRGDT